MNSRKALPGSRLVTIAGLIVGALGIAILWASGVAFPIHPPPGIVILLVGAVLVGLLPWRWAPVVGALLGLFILVGFLVSPTGLSNLFGRDGTSIAIGQAIEVIGALTALIAGVIAMRANVRVRAHGS
jgi:hypothetical protein